MRWSDFGVRPGDWQVRQSKNRARNVAGASRLGKRCCAFAAPRGEEGICRGAEIVNLMFARGVIINFAGNQVLRFAPPLIVSKDEIDTISIKK